MQIFSKPIGAFVAGALLLLTSAAAQANIIDLELKFGDVADVQVGDAFSVEVFIDSPANLTLTSFGFDFVDTLDVTSFSGFSDVTFDSFTVPVWMDSFDDPIFNQVEGFTNLLSAPISGDNTLIATMNFTATSLGTQGVSVFGGLLENDGGVFFDDFSLASIGGSFDVNIVDGNALQVAAPSTLLLFLLSAVAVIRLRSFKPKN